jgi:hypothetical protein
MRMSSAEAARYRADQQRLDLEASGKFQSTDQRLSLDDAIDGVRRKTQAMEDYKSAVRAATDAERERDRQDNAIEKANISMDREIDGALRKADATRLGVAASAEAAFFEKHLTALQQQRIDITDADIAGIKAQAQAFGLASQAAENMKQHLEMLQQSGQILSSALGNAFSSWTHGADVNVKQMVANMLAEFAKLSLMRSVLNPLFGGGGTGGGGIFGAGLDSVFSGFRADGGSVDASRAYIVGERGPELFVPGASGAIVPNGGGGNQISLSLHIDARGATPDAIAMLRAELPGHIMQTVREAQERGAL